jgi:hypothetical protein
MQEPSSNIKVGIAISINNIKCCGSFMPVYASLLLFNQPRKKCPSPLNTNDVIERALHTGYNEKAH